MGRRVSGRPAATSEHALAQWEGVMASTHGRFLTLAEYYDESRFPWDHAHHAYRMIFKSKISTPLKEPWHAVSVVGQSEACPAAKELRDKRYLSAEAPSLPLPQCSSPSLCKCVYRHYSDRRNMAFRRETDRGRFPRPRFGKERREGLQAHGRRADDQAD